MEQNLNENKYLSDILNDFSQQHYKQPKLAIFRGNRAIPTQTLFILKIKAKKSPL